MSKANDCWGIEVGAYAIKAIRLVRKAEELTLADYDVLPFKTVLTTPDLNVDEAIQVGLDQFLSRHNLSRSTVVISVPGHMAFARFAKLPPVEPKRIPDIVRFEAVQQIPFPIEDVEWDYQIFAKPDSPEVEVGIFAITKDRLAEVLGNYTAVGLNVDALTLSPLAVYNGLGYDMELDDESSGIILMDIGTTSTDVIIVEEGNLWLRTLPLGGNNFTEALVRSFKLSFPKAEKLKCEAGTSKYARQIFQAMRPVFADLVQEMQRSLGFYQSLNRDAKLTKLVGVGSTFRLPGMAKFLRQQLQLEVIRPDGFEQVRLDAKQAAGFAEHAINMATAYGLALQGLGYEEVSANILPRDLLKKRVWRAKQPWVGAAAALMIVATGAAWSGLQLAQATYNDTENDSKRNTIKSVMKEANDYKEEFQKVVTVQDPRKRIEELRKVLRDRDLWPKLLADIDQAKLALRPQQELLDNDWEKILKIKRSERRQMFIDSVETTYTVGYNRPPIWPGGGGVVIPEMGRAAGGVLGGGMPMAMGGAGGGMPTGMDDPMAMRAGAMGAGGGTAARVPETPRIEIMITGTTPFNPQAAALLEDGFCDWLRRHAERQGWPYRILPETVELVSITGSDASGGALSPRSGRSTGTRGAAGAALGSMAGGIGMRTGPTPGGAAGGLGGPMGGGSRPGGRSTSPTKTQGPAGGGGQELLQRPDDFELNEDQRFLITWTVELTNPDAAAPSSKKAGTGGSSSGRATQTGSAGSRRSATAGSEVQR